LKGLKTPNKSGNYDLNVSTTVLLLYCIPNLGPRRIKNLSPIVIVQLMCLKHLQITC